MQFISHLRNFSTKQNTDGISLYAIQLRFFKRDSMISKQFDFDAGFQYPISHWRYSLLQPLWQ